jgi:hypothetical protein
MFFLPCSVVQLLFQYCYSISVFSQLQPKAGGQDLSSVFNEDSLAAHQQALRVGVIATFLPLKTVHLPSSAEHLPPRSARHAYPGAVRAPAASDRAHHAVLQSVLDAALREAKQGLEVVKKDARALLKVSEDKCTGGAARSRLDNTKTVVSELYQLQRTEGKQVKHLTLGSHLKEDDLVGKTQLLEYGPHLNVQNVLNVLCCVTCLSCTHAGSK